MGSEAVKIPIIDFTSEDLKLGNPTWESAKGEVMTALEEFGCLKVQYDKIPAEIRKGFFDSSAKFFDQPLEAKPTNKMRAYYTIDDDYFTSSPLIESVGATVKPTIPEMAHSFSDLMWPEGNSTFRNTFMSYSDHLSRMVKIITRMILESLGLEKYMEEHMNFVYNTRLSIYKPPMSNETKIALVGHTDKNLLGILDQNGANGLEVRTKNNQWIEVDFSPNCFVVFVGDVFHAWTNGRLPAAFHRVTMAGKEARYSIGMFSNFKSDYIVEAPEEVVDEDYPRLYKPFDVSGLIATHLAFSTEYGSTLKTHFSFN